MIEFSPVCCGSPNQTHTDDDELIYLNLCECICHAEDEDE